METMAEQCGQRNGGQERGAPEVRGDHERAAAQAVDPDAGDEPDHQNRRRLQRGEQTHLGGRRPQQDDGRERERRTPDVRAEPRDRAAQPQLDEIRVTPQARERGAPGKDARHGVAPRAQDTKQKGSTSY